MVGRPESALRTTGPKAKMGPAPDEADCHVLATPSACLEGLSNDPVLVPVSPDSGTRHAEIRYHTDSTYCYPEALANTVCDRVQREIARTK